MYKNTMEQAARLLTGRNGRIQTPEEERFEQLLEYGQWGKVQHKEELAPGFWIVSTPSHGGMVICPALNALIPAEAKALANYSQASDGQYEEDCDWAIPFWFLESYLREFGNASVQLTLRDGIVGRTLNCPRYFKGVFEIPRRAHTDAPVPASTEAFFEELKRTYGEDCQ